MNPVAVTLWAFLAVVGFLAAGTTGALVGVAVGLGISLLSEFA